MSNLIFSLNATMPIFLTMILGLFFRKVGILDESFTSKMNKFVFKIALPVLLFQDLSDSDFSAVWDIKFVLFCFFATLLSILAVWGLSHLLKERSARGEFILPQQCGGDGTCLYPEYLRKFRHGAADDHQQCAAV